MRSVDRIASILREVATGARTVAGVSQRLGLDRATVWRILKSLEKHGFVAEDPALGGYIVGQTVFELASQAGDQDQRLVDCAREAMAQAQSETGETVTLHVRRGTIRVCIWEVESSHSIRYSAGIGAAAPVYVGSAGKVLLAWLADAAVRELVERIEFRALTAATITDRRALLRELDQVRAQGYATSFGERVPGSASLSVPVFTSSGRIAALSVLGPQFRIGGDGLLRFVPVLQRAARQVMDALSASGRPATGREEGTKGD